MSSSVLSHTVRELMRPVEFLNDEDSLDRAATLLRRANSPWIPVLSEERFVGVVSDLHLASRIAEGCELTSSIEGIVSSDVITISPYETGAEALRRLTEFQVPALLVVDDARQVLGVVAASDLAERRLIQPVPNLIGGMATPFGVHLTTGTVSAGVPWYALVSTGALLGTLLSLSIVVAAIISVWLEGLRQPNWLVSFASDGLPILFFFGAMRLIPLSGTHGAEHKVVHAIERGEPLVPEVVSRMPRVHQRCGTNLAVGAMIFLGIFSTPWSSDSSIRLLVAVVVTLSLWKRVGALMQRFITTKRPNPAQLDGAIRSAEEVLASYCRARVGLPTPFQRIWHSGMIHVIAGSTLAVLLIELILSLLGYTNLL